MKYGNPFDFAKERRAVAVGGRRFLVGKPTVETVMTAILLFYRELSAITEKAEEDPDSLGIDPKLAIARALIALSLPKSARVLSTCTSCRGMDADEVEQAVALDTTGETARQIAEALFLICDVHRIAKDIRLTNPEDGAPPEAVVEAPSLMTISIVSMAREFHVSPVDVMSWPYEAMMSAAQTIQYINTPPDERPGEWVRPGTNPEDAFQRTR